LRWVVEGKKHALDARLRAIADEKACPVQRGLAYLDGFLADGMCGRCLPCALGTYEARIRLERLAEGWGDGTDTAAIRRIAGNMWVGSLCKKGRQTAKYLFECLADEALQSHTAGRCPAMSCPAFIEYTILPDRCVMCGECKAVCEFNAILGLEKKGEYDTGYAPFEIRQKRCAKTGSCLKVCPVNAIVVVDKSLERIADLAA
jgi:ferredoxin